MLTRKKLQSLWDTSKQVTLRVLELLTVFFSAEFLAIMTQKDGGAIVAARAFLVSLWIYGLGLLLFNLAVCDLDPLFRGCHFDCQVAATQIQHSLKYYAGVLAGAYTALYARYSSRWHYLASLYNQIMQTEVASERRALPEWWAAFISDAYTLHLCSEELFASTISELGEDVDVLRALLDGTEAQEDYVRKILRGADRAMLVAQKRDDHELLGYLSQDELQKIDGSIEQRIVAASAYAHTTVSTERRARALLRSTAKAHGQPNRVAQSKDGKAWERWSEDRVEKEHRKIIAGLAKTGWDSTLHVLATWERARVMVLVRLRRDEGGARTWKAIRYRRR